MGGKFHTVKDISKTAHLVTKASEDLNAIAPERKERVAFYLNEIGTALLKISKSLRNSEPIDELAGSMKVHVLMFSETVSDVLDKNLTEKLEVFLGHAWSYESLEMQMGDDYLFNDELEDFPGHDQRQPVPELSEYRLKRLEEVAGIFKALASSVHSHK